MATGQYFIPEICFSVSGIFFVIHATSWNCTVYIRIAAVLIFSVVTIFIVESVYLAGIRDLLAENPASLTPDNLPSPPMICSEKSDLNVLLGNTAFGSSHFPFTAVKVEGSPVLTVNRGKDGGVYITLDVKDREGHLLARIVKNKVTVIPMAAYLVPRTSAHSLVIWDQFGNEAIDIYYLNKNAIRFTGYINEPGEFINVTKDDVSVDKQPLMEDGALCDFSVGLDIELNPTIHLSGFKGERPQRLSLFRCQL